MYRWVVFVHILSAFAFFMAHGASAAMAFRLKRETSVERIKAILDLSNAALPVMYFALMFLLLAGIIAGVMANWFTKGWIWTALGLMVVIWFGMQYYATRYYTPLRKAVGLPYRDGKQEQPAGEPATQSEIMSAVQATNPILLSGFAFGLVSVILWLMMFKPF